MTDHAKPTVVVAVKIADELLAPIRARANMRIVAQADADDPAFLAEVLAEADGALVTQRVPLGARLFDAWPRVKVLSKIGVGYDRIDVAAATERGILVCNTPGILSGAVADFVFLGILAVARKLASNEAHVRSGQWLSSSGKGHLGHDVRGTTLGIVGLGRIGKVVASTARGFDMRVVYYKPRRDWEAEAAGLAAYVDRDELFGTADTVVLCCPLTAGTRRSVGTREFSLMKRSATLVNVSRGGVLDQDAFIEAMQAKAIAGAALDVMTPEPLDPGHPLCALENVVLTPHIASGTVETNLAVRRMAVDNLLAGLDGRATAGSVNPQVLLMARHRPGMAVQDQSTVRD